MAHWCTFETTHCKRYKYVQISNKWQLTHDIFIFVGFLSFCCSAFSATKYRIASSSPSGRTLHLRSPPPHPLGRFPTPRLHSGTTLIPFASQFAQFHQDTILNNYLALDIIWTEENTYKGSETNRFTIRPIFIHQSALRGGENKHSDRVLFQCFVVFRSLVGLPLSVLIDVFRGRRWRRSQKVQFRLHLLYSWSPPSYWRTAAQRSSPPRTPKIVGRIELYSLCLYVCVFVYVCWENSGFRLAKRPAIILGGVNGSTPHTDRWIKPQNCASPLSVEH